MKKFPNIPKRTEEDYHSIKDDVLLVGVYTTWNVSVRGMLTPNAFLTAEVRETDDFKEYETVFMKVVVPMNQPQSVVSTQGTNRNTPRAHRSPTVSANPLEMKKRKERDVIAEATLLSLTLHNLSGFKKLNCLKIVVVEKLFYRNVVKIFGIESNKRYESSYDKIIPTTSSRLSLDEVNTLKSTPKNLNDTFSDTQFSKMKIGFKGQSDHGKGIVSFDVNVRFSLIIIEIDRLSLGTVTTQQANEVKGSGQSYDIAVKGKYSINEEEATKIIEGIRREGYNFLGYGGEYSEEAECSFRQSTKSSLCRFVFSRVTFST
ncbi:hypothetical protein Tco_0981851 [Tanacetum coccineum]